MVLKYFNDYTFDKTIEKVNRKLKQTESSFHQWNKWQYGNLIDLISYNYFILYDHFHPFQVYEIFFINTWWISWRCFSILQSLQLI